MATTFHVNVFLILERDGQVLLAERSSTGYADGWLNLPSGELEPGEDVITAVIREAREEIGVDIPREAVHPVHVMQHRIPEGGSRIGWFFTADRWHGEPYNAEPHKCAGLLWASPDDLPSNTWPYTAAGVAQYRAGSPFSVHGFTHQAATVWPNPGGIVPQTASVAPLPTTPTPRSKNARAR